MSFILDALRKSELERQRNRSPGMAAAREHPGRQRSRIWIPLVALLVGLNLGLLALLWYMSTARNDADNAVMAVTTPTRSAADSEFLYAPVPRSVLMNTDRPSRNLSDELMPPPTSPTPAAGAPPRPTARTTTQSANAPLPSFMEVLLDGSVSVSNLHLDVHVYSDRAEERFVFINTSRYREGDRLPEGPTVQEINAQGVVLSHQGRRFLLTRN